MTIANHYRSDDARKASDGRFVDADQRAPNMVPGIEARIGWPDDAVIDGQRLRSDPKNRRGPIHKKAQCLRCGSAGLCAELDRVAGDRRSMVGRDRAVAEHHRDAPEGDVQLFRDDLR
jgi:hypothetical protein